MDGGCGVWPGDGRSCEGTEEARGQGLPCGLPPASSDSLWAQPPTLGNRAVAPLHPRLPLRLPPLRVGGLPLVRIEGAGLRHTAVQRGSACHGSVKLQVCSLWQRRKDAGGGPRAAFRQQAHGACLQSAAATARRPAAAGQALALEHYGVWPAAVRQEGKSERGEKLGPATAHDSNPSGLRSPATVPHNGRQHGGNWVIANGAEQATQERVQMRCPGAAWQHPVPAAICASAAPPERMLRCLMITQIKMQVARQPDP